MIGGAASTSSASCCKAFWLTFFIAHPLLSIYLIKTEIYSKTYRASIYFIRIILFLTFTSILGEGAEPGKSPWLDFFDLKVMLILLPYLIIEPIAKILEWLNQPKSVLLKSSSSQSSSPSSIKCRYYFGKFIIFAVLGGCIFSIFVISSNQTSADRE